MNTEILNPTSPNPITTIGTSTANFYDTLFVNGHVDKQYWNTKLNVTDVKDSLLINIDIAYIVTNNETGYQMNVVTFNRNFRMEKTDVVTEADLSSLLSYCQKAIASDKLQFEKPLPYLHALDEGYRIGSIQFQREIQSLNQF
ncbi:MAG: hypothetical protein QM737_10535 [Ferruginibacter sp.]